VSFKANRFEKEVLTRKGNSGSKALTASYPIEIIGVMNRIVNIVSTIIYTLFAVSGIIYFAFLGYYLLPDVQRNSETSRTLLSHASSTLGLPFAAMGAFILVGILRASTDQQTLKFKGLSFDVTGPASQLMYWIVAFLSIVGAIRLLAPL
jgi:hypothetical protein